MILSAWSVTLLALVRHETTVDLHQGITEKAATAVSETLTRHLEEGQRPTA
jgi:hypothetical protein